MEKTQQKLFLRLVLLAGTLYDAAATEKWGESFEHRPGRGGGGGGVRLCHYICISRTQK